MFKSLREFFSKMFSGDSDVSSKRVLGTFLIVGVYGLATLISTFKGAVSLEVVELLKVGLYVGASLVGLGIADRWVLGLNK